MDVEAELLWLRGVVGVRGWRASHGRQVALDAADEDVVGAKECRPLLACGRPRKGWAVHEKLLAAAVAPTSDWGAALGVHLGGSPLEISFGPSAGRLRSVPPRRGRARGAQKGEVRSEPILLISILARPIDNFVFQLIIFLFSIDILLLIVLLGLAISVVAKPYLVLVKRCSRL